MSPKEMEERIEKLEAEKKLLETRFELIGNMVIFLYANNGTGWRVKNFADQVNYMHPKERLTGKHTDRNVFINETEMNAPFWEVINKKAAEKL